MIDTDLKAFESDLNEVLNLFPDSENIKVRHAFKEGDGKVVNTVTVNGSVFAYGNLINKNAISQETINEIIDSVRYSWFSLLL